MEGNSLASKDIKGSEVYSKLFLKFYDFYVLSFACGLIWKCPKWLICSLYNQYLSDEHLEIGVGTGYFLDKCVFPSVTPNVTLVDLNQNCLDATATRLQRYQPETYVADIFKELQIPADKKFDSVGMNYLLHCLPGTMDDKAKVFANIKPYLNPGAVVFGATVLGKNINMNFLVNKYLGFCNKVGAFTNSEDDMAGLERILKNNFREVFLLRAGCAAIFVAKM